MYILKENENLSEVVAFYLFLGKVVENVFILKFYT